MDEKLIRAIAKQFYLQAYEARDGDRQQKRDAGMAVAQEFLRDVEASDPVRMAEEIEAECSGFRVASFGSTENRSK